MYLKLHFLKKIFLIYIKKLKNFIYATLIKIFNKICQEMKTEPTEEYENTILQPDLMIKRTKVKNNCC